MKPKLVQTLTVAFGITIQIGAYIVGALTDNDTLILITSLLILIGGIILPFTKKYKLIGIGFLICSGINILLAIGLFVLVSSLH
jgi:predicted MFS family arabinose efflux permease